MITSKIDQTKNIIFADYSGSIHFKDIVEFYSQLASQYQHWNDLKLIQDERNANFIETNEIVENAQDLINIIADSFKSIRIAVIQDRPIETAYSYLFLKNSLSHQYFIKVFNIEENAIKWLS